MLGPHLGHRASGWENVVGHSRSRLMEAAKLAPCQDNDLARVYEAAKQKRPRWRELTRAYIPRFASGHSPVVTFLLRSKRIILREWTYKPFCPTSYGRLRWEPAQFWRCWCSSASGCRAAPKWTPARNGAAEFAPIQGTSGLSIRDSSSLLL